jgi:hypothetical protein
VIHLTNKVVIPNGLPTVYADAFEVNWLEFDDYREAYAIIFGDYPMRNQHKMGYMKTVFFLSPVDSNLHPDYIRILSVDVYFDNRTMFLEDLRYYGEFMWDELKSANDVDDALQDNDEYIEMLFGFNDIYYLDEVIFSYKQLRDELAFNYRPIYKHKGGMRSYDSWGY